MHALSVRIFLLVFLVATSHDIEHWSDHTAVAIKLDQVEGF